MFHNPMLVTEIDILVLLAVACLTAIALKRVRFPYTVALLLLGIVLGWLGQTVADLDFLQTLTLSHDLILFVFVPPLIFESALNLDSRLLLRNLIPILTLAAPGLLLSTAIVGFILSWGTPLDLPQALLFGSLISATDPVAVIALFKELGAPKRLGILVEGESLFNDATAIVTFNIILAVMTTGQGCGLSALGDGVWAFGISFVGGIVLGAVVGFAIRLPMALIKDNPLVLATLTTIVAYATFLLAEEVVHVSGVIAIVSAGIVLGWYKSNYLKPENRQFLGEFWEYLAFLANSLIFLLVGLTVSDLQFFGQVEHTPNLVGAIGLTLITVLGARALVVFGLTTAINLLRPAIAVPLSYQAVSWWGGLRGAVCLALALSFEPDFPNRDLMLMLTLGVVLFTLLIPGTTIAALLRQLGLDLSPLFDRLNGALAMTSAQRVVLDQAPVLETTFVNPQSAVIATYRQKYKAKLEQAHQQLIALVKEADEQTLQQWVWSSALNLEQQTYQTLYDEGFITGSFLSQFKLMINLKQDQVAAGKIPPVQPQRMILEARWQNFQLKLWERWWPERAEGVRSQILFNTYQFWGITAYATRTVTEQLQTLFQNDIGDTLLAPCIVEYDHSHQAAQQQLIQLSSETESLIVNTQTQITKRVAQYSQSEVVKNMMDIGVLNQTIGRSLLNRDDF